MTTRRPHLYQLAAVVIVSLVAAACTSDGDDPATATDEVVTSSTTSVATAETEPPATSDGSDEPAEALTASHRGVTAEAITIGVAAVDLEQINDLFGLDFAVTPTEEMYQATVDVVNEAGGINGRELQIEFRGFQPVGAEGADQVCLELMEDEEVFVVIGQFLQDSMLCITDTYGHPYVGLFGETPERQQKSDGLFFAVEISQVDQRSGGTQAMVDAGDFDGRKVAVVWASAADAVYFDAVDPVLDAAGVDVVAEIEVDAFTTDEVNNDAAWDIAMERIQAAEADLVLNLSGITGVLDAVERNGAPQIVAHTNGQAADGATVLEESIAGEAVLSNSFAVTTWKPDRDESLADAGVQDCIADFEAAFPDIEIDLTSDDWVNAFRNTCAAVDLTAQILQAAGPDLNPETFRTGGESLGAIDLPGMSGSFIGPESHSAGAVLSRYEYDAQTKQYVKVGEPIPTG
ncbi:MAG: ABC transporter substrate-binding protein [Acidimicrobiales bacterium]